ncbi:MAG: polymer-forming cytoskeletal protein [Azospirillaceae bacterium]
MAVALALVLGATVPLAAQDAAPDEEAAVSAGSDATDPAAAGDASADAETTEETGTAEEAATRGGASTITGREVVGTSATGKNVAAAGALVALSADTEEDAMVAGGTVRADGRVGGDLFAVGGRVRAGAAIGEDAFLAGGNVSLGANATVGSDLFAAGGDLTIDGTVAGDALLGGGTIEIAGTIEGDVEAAGGSLILLPGARIGGDLRFHGADPPEIVEGATVGGTVTHDRIMPGERGERGEDREHRGWIAGLVGGVLFTIGVMIAGALWLAASPQTVTGAARSFRESPVIGGLLGLAVAAVWPLATLLAAVTVIGLPVAGVLFLLYPIVLFAGYLAAAFGLSDVVLARRILPPGYGLRVLAFVIAVLVLAVVSLIPFLGTLAVIVIFLVGLGALARSVFAGRDEDAVI